jgi:TrmH family RNA methyltransferase
MKGLRVLMADMGGTACWECDLRSPLALIIGGEAGGASPAARRLAASTIGIPMPGGSESLNAASAGTVLLFEVVRQRRVKA